MTTTSNDTIAELLQEEHLQLTEAELVHAVRALLGPPPPPPGVVELSAHDRDVIEQHGGVRPYTPDELAASRARQVARMAAFVMESPTTVQVAARMGVDPSRVRHLTSEGALYALRVGRQNRYPAWQFADDGRPLPGLKTILGALPPDLHPVEVRGFFTTPDREYQVGGRWLTAAEWLAEGGDPGLIVAATDTFTVAH